MAFQTVDDMLAPYEADKQRVMSRTEYEEIKAEMRNLPKVPRTADYKKDLETIYWWPRNLAKDKIARALDPCVNTSREEYYTWLQWAHANALTKSKTIKTMMKEFDKVHYPTARPSREPESSKNQSSRKQGSTVPKRRGRKNDARRRNADNDGDSFSY